MTPEITQEQEEKYKKELERIVSNSSDEIKEKWRLNNTITWVKRVPLIHSNVHLDFIGKEKDDFEKLKRRVENNTL